MKRLLVFVCVVALAFSDDHPRESREDEHHGRPREDEHHMRPMPERKPLKDVARLPPFWMPNPKGKSCEYLPSTCDMACSNGYQTDKNGCPICKCVQDPCESLTCGKDEICHIRPCLEHPCTVPKADCVKNTICHDDRAHRMDMADVVLEHSTEMVRTDMKKKMLLPECTEQGKYKPLQCATTKRGKECWCVNPFGEEIEGTRYPVQTEEDLPTCIAQRTNAAVILFHMKHQLEDAARDHIKTVRSELMIKIPAWMAMDKDHFVTVEVAIHDPEHFVVEILVQARDSKTDLTEAVHQIGKHIRKDSCQLNIEGKKVEAEAHTLDMRHEDKGEREETWKEWGCREFRKYYRRHPVAFIVAPVVIGFFLIVGICSICLVCCRKRRLAKQQFAHKQFDANNCQQKSEKYKQNLVLGHSVDMCEKKEALA